jgi:N-acetyl-gamma-glutamyl-phosphate reductase
MSMAVQVAVVGATGYAGAEAVRLLAQHPEASCAHLGALGDLRLEPVDPAAIAARAQVALLSLPARQSLELAPELLRRGVRVIDFGADFRLRDPEAYARHYGGPHTAPEWLREAVYGLTELHRAEVRTARLVANPGCYPAAAVLALAPALRAGFVEPAGIVIDAKSGVSGAGRQPAPHLHFPEIDGSVAAYAVAGAHRHTPEIEQELARAAGQPVRVTFSPHLVPMARGLLATCYARLVRPVAEAEVRAAYQEAYRGEPFVQVLAEGLPQTKAVAGSNVAQLAVAVDARAGCLVALAAIDNLGKGAAGSAIQNLNVMFGLEETLGLPRVGLYP